MAALFLSLTLASVAESQARPSGTLIIAVARDISTPIPTLWTDQVNREASDLLFLRLADLGAAFSTTDEKSFRPRLARRWSRRDSVTVAFTLDARARWHDGVRVTARDVVFALDRARNPRLAAQTALLLRRIASVTAEGDSVVVFRFTEPYAEQVYDAVYQAPPLPAHLLEQLPPESLLTSTFRDQPVGNGPYRFVRRAADQVTELGANEQFFLGRPGIGRVLFLVVKDAEARVNLLLNGGIDALDNIYALENWGRLEHLPDYPVYPLPGAVVQYADFNERDPADTSRPHPLFGDPVIRRALAQAIDRTPMVRAVYGPLARVPEGPVSALLGRTLDAPPAIRFDSAGARRLLASRGWQDHNGDGVLDKDGQPLTFRVLLPVVVSSRIKMATLMQEAWRRIGVQAELDVVSPDVFLQRRRAGAYDVELQGASQDPSPSGLTVTWTCSGPLNVMHYCSPSIDSLLQRAAVSPGGRMARTYSEAVRRIAADVPAIFIATPVMGVPVHRRFGNVTLRPESMWSEVWQWTLKPGQQIDRDRQ
jgi:peptide/nickel transport system substrate-binding protein